MEKWRAHWNYSVNSPQLDAASSTVVDAKSIKGSAFIGYVSQQYIAKRDASGERRPVKSYDEIIRQIDSQITQHFKDGLIPPTPYEIGQIPNLHSLAPMSQSRRKPIFSLTAADGIVGAHFAKVKEAKEIFGEVSANIRKRLV